MQISRAIQIDCPRNVDKNTRFRGQYKLIVREMWVKKRDFAGNKKITSIFFAIHLHLQGYVMPLKKTAAIFLIQPWGTRIARMRHGL